ncbi:MAG TPA: branched-chain amino acid ABC transporter permease, partial [Burkholderiales bacterium]
MSGILLLEQSLNSLQFGLMLFLLAAGLTLVFGIMDMINLAHGSLYMIGAYLMASLAQATGSFWIALPLALAATALVGAALEVSLLRKLYERDHLTQVLATFAIILVVNEVVRIVWGDQSLMLNAPPSLTGPVELPGGVRYASYRLAIIGIGVLVALVLYFLVTRT